MKKRVKLVYGVVLSLVFACSVMGCNRTNDASNDDVNATDETVISEEPSSSEGTEVETFDITKMENELSGVDITITPSSHNVFSGTFGDEEILLQAWVDEDTKTVSISFVGSYHSEMLSFDCELLEDGFRYQDDDYYLLLKQQEDDSLAGYFYETGKDVVDCNLNLYYTNSSTEKDSMYTIGTDEDVEDFATQIIEAINAEDLETFSTYVQYPIFINIDGEQTSIQSADVLLKQDETKVFNSDFLAAMANVYPNFLFENYQGVMIGSGEYNVWFNTDENGDFKIIGINN